MNRRVWIWLVPLVLMVSGCSTLGQKGAIDEARQTTESVEAVESKPAETVEERAQSGEADAQFQLGMDAVVKEVERATSADHSAAADGDGAEQWLRKSAEQGHVEAQTELGMLYLMQENSEAERWLLLAAQQGSTVAQGALGEMYQSGIGVPVDEEKAAYWFQQADR